MDFDAVIRGDADARRASTDVAKILEKFKQESVQSVVVDLRNNGGGSLPDAIILSGLFLSGNPVVQVHGKNELEKEFDPSPAVLYSGPLVVLTSKLSASAAEIFTGAMADAKRAVVVGDSRTFGKGTVLRVESLDRYGSWFKRNMQAGSLTFEIAMFFRPGGSSVQQYGIKPDIQLPSVTEEISAGEIFLDNHLPWDEIEPISFPLWDKNMDGKIEILRKKSAERIAADQHYQAFIRQIAVYRSLRDKKELSLNEESRYAEYLKEKDISESIDKILSDSADPDKNRDVVLSEAINIAADLSKL
jgi:carboxyl-terminal processing protease